MNLEILNGPAYPPEMRTNPSYRGTDRAEPSYCDALPADHEINRLFLEWFVKEGGELGVVHDLAKAYRFAELWNQHLGEQRYEVVEVTDGNASPESKGDFAGYDLSAGYGFSLIYTISWKSLRTQDADIPKPFGVLCELMGRHFEPQLNKYGLFPTFEVASFCLRVAVLLRSLCPETLFESNDDIMASFKVVGVYLLPER